MKTIKARLFCVLAINSAIVAGNNCATAQVIPDNTLGSESSTTRLNPQFPIDLIRSGTTVISLRRREVRGTAAILNSIRDLLLPLLEKIVISLPMRSPGMEETLILRLEAFLALPPAQSKLPIVILRQVPS